MSSVTHPKMLSKVQRCEKIIGYQFTNQHLCWEALQMAGNGVTSSGQRTFLNGNKRLAILGDFVLALVLSQDWYDSGAPEGAWDSQRQSKISNAKLGALGKDLNLRDCVQLGNGQADVSMRMMAGTVEAIIGSVYLDRGEGGIAAAKGVMQNLGIVHAEPAR